MIEIPKGSSSPPAAAAHKLKCFCQICEKLSLCYPKFSASFARAASLEGKTGLKVFTEPTQTTVFKHFLFKVLITAQRQTEDKWWNKSGTQLERSVQVEELPLKTFILGPIKYQYKPSQVTVTSLWRWYEYWLVNDWSGLVTFPPLQMTMTMKYRWQQWYDNNDNNDNNANNDKITMIGKWLVWGWWPLPPSQMTAPGAHPTNATNFGSTTPKMRRKENYDKLEV